MNQSYIKTNVDSKYHYSGEYLLVRKGMFDYLQLNPLQEMIVLMADGSRTKDEVYHTVLHNFDIEDIEKNQRLFDTVLGHLAEKQIISFCENKSEDKIEISGEKGKQYPDWIMVEATDKCNFRCPHCYKNAGIAGRELSLMKFENIVYEMKQKASNMIITGGEPCCNSNIVHFLTLAEQHFHTYLLTNGYLLQNIPMDIISRLKGVQISLYGYDEDSCYEFTGTRDSFNKVCHSVRRLTQNHIEVSLTTIITCDNMDILENYVKVAIMLGASSLMFGISAPLGRLKPNNKHFLFDAETHKRMRERVLGLREKYKDEIAIIRMGDITSFTPKLGDTFHCQAGKTTIVITEEGEVVPCHMVTRSIFQGYSFESYMNDIKQGETRDYTEQVKQFKQFMEKQGAKAQDLYCTGFCNVPDADE